MDLFNLLIAFVVLLAVAVCWFGLYYLNNKPLEKTDGYAKITGNCGDTMEIALEFGDGKVRNSRGSTDGCSVSKSCVEAAALLAPNRAADDLERITMMSIMEQIGQLPDSHLHCAQLAETTLHSAVKDYRARQPTSCC